MANLNVPSPRCDEEASENSLPAAATPPNVRRRRLNKKSTLAMPTFPEIQPFQQCFVMVNKVPTLVMTYGSDIQGLQQKPTQSPQTVVLIIPGNPGIIQVYQEFMATLHKALGGSIHVWGISHAGHVNSEPHYSLLPLDGNERLYDLKAQIRHKLEFVRLCIPAGTRLFLVGHSIGSYVALHMLDQLETSYQVEKAYMLFPTVERMAVSPNGKLFVFYYKYFRNLAIIAAQLMSYLSPWMQYKCIEWYLYLICSREPPHCVVEGCLNIFLPAVLRNVFFMAYDEMLNVRDANLDLLAKYVDKLTFYYGTTDQWCPIQYYKDMKQRLPQGDVQVCSRGFEHAFVFDSSREMAEATAKWIQNALEASQKRESGYN